MPNSTILFGKPSSLSKSVLEVLASVGTGTKALFLKGVRGAHHLQFCHNGKKRHASTSGPGIDLIGRRTLSGTQSRSWLATSTAFFPQATNCTIYCCGFMVGNQWESTFLLLEVFSLNSAFLPRSSKTHVCGSLILWKGDEIRIR